MNYSFVFISAFIFSLMPFQNYEAHGFFLAFIVLAASVVSAILKGGKAIKPDAILVLGFLFWGLALVSAFLSEAPFVSFIYFCFFSALPLTLLLTLYVPKPLEFFKITGVALMVIIAGLAVFSFVEYLFLPSWLHKGYACWPLADPNSLAGLFSFAFFGGFGLMLAGRSRLESNAGLVLSLLFFSAILLTGSKGAIVAMAIALMVFIILGHPHVVKHIKCCGILATGAGLALLLAWIQGATGFHIASGGVGHGDIDQRIAEIASTWRIAMDHFWTGTGIGTFFLYYPAYRGADYHSAGFMAHNDPLQFFSEMGIFAPVLFYAFIIAAIVKTVKALRPLAPQDPARILILVPFSALGAMIAHTHINFHFNILSMLMLTGLLTGFWYLRIAQSSETLSSNSYMRQIAAFAFVMLALVFAGLQGGNILTSRAVEKINAGDLQGFAADINLAGVISMKTDARALTLAASIPIGVLESRKKHLSKDEKEKLVARAEALLVKAEKLNPRLAAVYFYRARLADIFPQESTPEQFLQKALSVDPMHTAARLALADRQAAQGHKKEALETLKAGQEWPNVTGEYLYKMAMLAKEAGDMETQDTALARLLIVNGREIATVSRQQGLRSAGTLQ